MTKILTIKLIVIFTLFFISPLQQPLFAQEDDFNEIESDDWSDDAFEDDEMFEDEPGGSTKSESSNDNKKENLPPFTQEKKKTVQPPLSPIKSTPKAPEPEKRSTPSLTPTPVVSKPRTVFEPVTQTQPQYSVSNTVKRAGPPMVLISRPVYAPYSEEKNTQYISAIAEAYFHFKIGALPGIQVVPFERINNNIQYFRDFSRRISRSAYEQAAKKLGATYLIFLEYEPKGKKVKMAAELRSITDNKKLAALTNEFELNDFENGLFDFMNEMAGALVGTIPSNVQEFLASPVLGKNKIESLGNLIVSLGDYTQKNAEKFAPQFSKLAKDRSIHLAKFAAAPVLARANMIAEAISVQQQLINTFGNQYPALSLQLADFYRMQGSFNDAIQSTIAAAREPSLALLVKIKKARIYEAQGNLDRAKQEYEAALSEGGEDGDIYFQLALVSIGLNNLQQAQNYLSKTAQAGRTLDRGDYYELGLRYEALGAHDQAINAFRNSLSLQQDNIDAWQKLSEIYTLSGRDAEAAECYVNMFHINNEMYKDYLKKAGIMFENASYLENAKEAYALFLARRFDDPEVSVRLAKLEANSGNCRKAIELVDGMDTTGIYGQDVLSINTQCGKKERRVVVPTETGRDKRWRAVFVWRILSIGVSAGGIGAGLVFENLLKKASEEYHAYPSTNPGVNIEVQKAEVAKRRKKCEDMRRARNLCYAGAGIGGCSLALSIVLPIVIPK